MTKTKAKNDLALSNKPQRGFLTAWVISHVAFWMVMWLPYTMREEWRSYGFSYTDTASPVFILITTLIISLLQWRITQRVLNHSMRGWVPASLVGALLSILAFTSDPNSGLYPSVLALLLPIALVQTLWLSRHVKSAWLWFVASGVGALFFAFPLSDHDYSKGSYSLVPWIIGLAISQGIIQAVVMRHLWLNTEETQKAKQHPLVAEEADDEDAIQRLGVQETDIEMIDETPLRQQQSR